MKRFILPLLLFPLIASAEDDIAPLSDEFDDLSTMNNWLRLNDTEGWDADKLEVHDIDTSRAGNMRLTPHTTVWFMDMSGPLVYKEITGDFAVTMQIEVSRKNGDPGRPTRAFSVAGIMMRKPRAIVAAGPDPDSGSGVTLSWPPVGYATDWTPDEESYLYLSIGSGGGGAADQWNYEAKSTVDGVSVFYSDNQGVPTETGVATLQVIRRGATFLLLRKHGAGNWILESRYERPDLPATLQVGATAYGDWDNITGNGLYSGPDDHDGQYHHNHNVISTGNGFTSNPDLVADVDYIRFLRLPESVTQLALQALPLTQSGGGVELLADSAMSGILGDPLSIPYEEPEPALPRPDMTIGKTSGSQRGDEIYNQSGAGQRLKLKAKRLRQVKVHTVIQNDGTGADQIQMRGSRGNRYFRVKYFHFDPTRRNVTGLITKGGFLTGMIASGESEKSQVLIKPRRKPKQKTFRITGESGGVADTVVFRVKSTVKR